VKWRFFANLLADQTYPKGVRQLAAGLCIAHSSGHEKRSVVQNGHQATEQLRIIAIIP
jgi:hypothetical protein